MTEFPGHMERATAEISVHYEVQVVIKYTMDLITWINHKNYCIVLFF